MRGVTLRPRTKEYCDKWLTENIPKMKGDVRKLMHAIAELEKEHPKRARNFVAFKLYWGLQGEAPLTLTKLAERMDSTPAQVHELWQRAYRMLRHTSHAWPESE